LEKLAKLYPKTEFNLQIDVNLGDEEEREPYTNAEKYEAMRAKNPKIDDLRKKMGLKIDY